MRKLSLGEGKWLSRSPKWMTNFSALSTLSRQLINEACSLVGSSMCMNAQKPPFPPPLQPFCAKALIIGTWIVPRATLDLVPQTSPPHTALKASLGEKAQGGEEGKGAAGVQGPCLPQLHSRSLERQKAARATGIISSLYHAAQWGILDPCPPKLRAF